ncbi:MAG: aldehyde ferredoxin oxidoreductase family protein [Proteobacteria bacterium]|nr:aldehyde ferredoxin oxidoreductase family protein [Pseudomonadota bacterium]
MYGYHGKFLQVDLSGRKTQEMPLSEEDLKNYIGGATLAAKLIYPRVKKGMVPMEPENPLVFATGPFTGTKIPMVSRYAACGISPLTGYWGEATSGGSFPFRLKGTGYDGLFIEGKAEKPVYLLIKDGSPEIKDASHLWGKDSYETQKMLKAEIEEGNPGVACIGPAGENLVRYAGIMNDQGRAAGRCGMGALMGSKNLKAVVAVGNAKPDPAKSEDVKAMTETARKIIKKSPMTYAWREYGTMMYPDMGMAMGDVPAKYFTKSVFQVEKITGQALRREYAIGRFACQGCPVACGREVKDFSSELASIDGPEYETTAAFGPLCMILDFDTIIRANHLCNVSGMDTISAGVSIAYAIYLAELGVLTQEETGLDLKWGNGEAVLKLLEMVAAQEGLGKLVSQGTLQMARQLGRDPGEAAQVKGLEMPMHDPRAFHGMAISYATGPRGACHLKGEYYNVDMGTGVKELNVKAGDRLSSVKKGDAAARYQSFKDLYDSLPLCKFSPLSVTQISAFLSGVTGWDYSPDDLLLAGDRSMNVKRAINNKLGLTRADDRIPKICLDALDEGSTAGVSPDMDLLLKDYYQYRQWDWKTGKPTKEKLIEQGMEEIARDLYP